MGSWLLLIFLILCLASTQGDIGNTGRTVMTLIGDYYIIMTVLIFLFMFMFLVAFTASDED